MPNKVLVLVFRNQQGATVRISIANVKDDITDIQVKTAMEDIIAKNIFETDGGNIVSISGAQIVTRTTEELSVN